MGLLQKAVETYDCHAQLAGVYSQDHPVLPPIYHTIASAKLEICLNSNGDFVSACAVDSKEPKIIIPVTEKSAGRAGSTVCAHPLSDQLCYLAPYNEAKYADYKEKLKAWCESEYTHPKLRPILNYIEKGCILNDLQKSGLITLSDDGIPSDEKALVRWRVTDDNSSSDACWLDTSLFRAFELYYKSQHENDSKSLCMITGEFAPIASNNPKNIIATSANAKLISSNDTSGFTYLGRFTDDKQAAGISYEASQKAHNALRWLAADQGAQVVFGGRTFLCWNPHGHKVCQVSGAFAKKGKVITEPTDYKQELKNTLNGYMTELPKTEGVVIAVFDAATSGRLSLTYYNELMSSDFLQRLYEWDLYCSWPTSLFGIQSPSLFQIVNCAFGTMQTEKGKDMFKTDDRVLRQQMQRLVSCRIDKSHMPSDIAAAITHRCSRLQLYDSGLRNQLLSTACAVIRKYRYDVYKEECEMTLEENKPDRSYQFGRLLAVLEKVERDTYGSDEGREPSAIRQQSVFCQRPMYAAGNIEMQLERAYFPRLKPGTRIFYKNLIGQIMEQINAFPQEQWNKPLKETYLMGYYLQRNVLYTSKNKNEEEQENG